MGVLPAKSLEFVEHDIDVFPDSFEKETIQVNKQFYVAVTFVPFIRTSSGDRSMCGITKVTSHIGAVVLEAIAIFPFLEVF